MGSLEAKRAALQKHLEKLKKFEREYRTRLKAYLESQLRDLEGRSQSLEAEINRSEGGNRSGGSPGGLAGSQAGRLVRRWAVRDRRRRPLADSATAGGRQRVKGRREPARPAPAGG